MTGIKQVDSTQACILIFAVETPSPWHCWPIERCLAQGIMSFDYCKDESMERLSGHFAFDTHFDFLTIGAV